MLNNTSRLYLFAVSMVLFSGCAEGMFWKTGYLSPWARQQWSAEEAIAPTAYARREKMEEVVATALAGNEESQEKASEYLSEIVNNDPVLLMRIEATRLLGDLPTETAAMTLQAAAKDREVEIRQAAIRSLNNLKGDVAAEVLAQMAQTDSDVDVRLAATRALADFPGNASTRALANVIADPNPALQLRAAEALVEITDENFGNDISAWQTYLASLDEISDQSKDRTASEDGEKVLPKFR